MALNVHRYLGLLEHPTPVTLAPPAIRTVEAARALVAHAHQHGPLPLLGAWRLHPSHARLLERTTGASPTGGWAALAGLLGGTPLMQVTNDGFIATCPLHRLDLWTPALIQRAIIESLTCRMAPPITAAGIFMLMGLNPITGLHLARSIHDALVPWDAPPDSARTQLIAANLDRDPLLATLRDCFFGIITVLLEALRTLAPGNKYPIDALANLALAICASHREQLWQAASPTQRAQLFLFDPDSLSPQALHERALDFVTLDLLDGYLVPAGLARRLEGGMFAPCHDTLMSNFDIVGVDPNERAMWLSRFLTEDADELCA
jgi:hypothetical protein